MSSKTPLKSGAMKFFSRYDNSVHEVQWHRGRLPRTLCHQWTFSENPSQAMVDRGRDLNVDCIGCLGAMVD